MSRFEASRSQAIIDNLQETLRSVDPDRVEGLNEDAERVLSMAREVVAEASPIPVPFGRWAEIDGLRAANWDSLAQAIETMNKLMGEVVRHVQEGRPADGKLQAKIQHENNKLVKLASGVMGQISTHSPINGEFSHPIVSINLMGAVLERAELPFDMGQKVALVRIGTEYDLEYERLNSTYTAETPRLQKLVDELTLKRDSMELAKALLTREQRDRVLVEEIQGRLQVDVLSPLTMALMLVKPKNFNAKEEARDMLPGVLASNLGLNPSQKDALTDALDAWYEEVKPLLEKVTPEETLLHIDEVVTAGRAFANLFKAVLELKDLDTKARQNVLNEVSWRVPRVVREPIEKIRQKIETLRRGTIDERLADELKELGSVLEGRDQKLEAVSAFREAVEIYRKTLGDSWSSDPLRYRLRDLVWRIAIDPDKSNEHYERARQGAETVLALKPDSPTSLATLGIVHYRLGDYEKAKPPLSEAAERRGTPMEVAFLAMTHHKLHQSSEARAGLLRARELMRSRKHSENTEYQTVLAEAKRLFEGAEKDDRSE